MTSIKSIKTTLDRLLVEQQPTNGNAIEQLKFAYTRKVCLDIKEIIDPKTADSLSALKGYLAVNAKLVRGSSLDYTAIPKSGVTELLVSVAVYVSEHLDSITSTPIELLYPTISFISKSNAYPDLGAELASTKPTTEERDEFSRLEQRRNREPTQRENIEKAIQRLIEKFSAFKTDEDKVAAGTHHRRRGSIVPIQNPLSIIESHILSDDHKSLIPALELISDTPKRVYDNTYTELTTGEMMRLRGHNNVATCYATTKRSYDLLISDESHLEGHLQVLIKKLKLNDAHGGSGTQELAGEDAYLAIVDFKLYYDRLTPQLKSQLPEEVASEIELLFHLTSLSRSVSEQTCIGLRREALERVVKQHEARLVAIAVTGEKKAEQLAQLTKQLNQLIMVRHMFVARESHDGDKLPLKEDLLMLFDIQIEFGLLTNFYTFMQMANDDIRVFAANPNHSKALAGALKTKNQFLTFIRELPNEKVALYFKVTEPFISIYPEFKGINIAELFIRLHDEKIMICMDSAWGKSLILTVSGLTVLLRSLSPNQRAIVLSSMVDRIPAIIQSAEELKTVLIYLSETQCAFVCESMKVQLPTILTSSNEFKYLLHVLSEAKRRSVYEAMQARLPAFIKSGSDFWNVVRFLSEAQRTSVFQAMQAQLPAIITTKDDFKAVLQHLTNLQCAALCEAMKTQLPAIITSGREFGDVLQHSSKEQRTSVFEAMQTLLPDIIRSGDDFASVMGCLSNAQGDIVCEVIKTKFQTIIKSYNEFAAVLNRLRLEVHGAIFCEAMKTKLPAMITSADKLRHVLQNIFKAQRPNVYEAMKTQLPAMIRTGGEFSNVLEYLSEVERTNIYETMQSKLPVIIRSDGNFSGVLAYLSEGQRLNVYEEMKKQLPAIITSVCQVKSSLFYLSEGQCKAFCESMKTQLPAIIRSCSDFGYEMWCLSEPKRTSLYEVMKEQLPAMITSSGDFQVVLRNLSLEQQAALTASVLVLIGQKTFQEQTVFFENAEPGAFLRHYDFIKVSKRTCFLAGFKWHLARLREEEASLTTQGSLEAASTTHDLHAKLDDALQQVGEDFPKKLLSIIGDFRSVFNQGSRYSPLFFSTGSGKIVDDMSHFVKATPSR